MDENKTPQRKKENPLVFFLYLLFWIAILILFGGLFVNQMNNYNELRTTLTSVESEIAEERNTTAYLEQQMLMFDSDAYMEYLARRRGMVRPNEIIFRNIAD